MTEIRKQGNLSINSENIFPIIKKWLYQDHDIFYRELISNGCDAVTKLKKLQLIGEYTAPADEKYRIDVLVDPAQNRISFSDNGIGMTAEEVDSYINQIAFSGAADFLAKYRDKANEDQIIGHFGLGFYSAFMVADRVEIDTLSYLEGAEPVSWVSSDGMEYEMSEGTRTTHGTTVTLTINEEELQFCNEYKAREVIEKYCSFMPVEIYLRDASKPQPEAGKSAAQENAGEARGTVEVAEETAGQETEGQETAEQEKEPSEKPLNDIHPLWGETPSQVTEEQYKEFYRKVFKDYREPLFWIHLNMDYPFNLKGILYFPKINYEYENLEGTIKLYNNQVFIADNIKEVIPEYLLLLKGVIDCPDLPLNVSRSALQNDGFVKKISDYITKKVSDKLTGMFKTDRENYEKYWDDISPFIKYGCIKDEKFGDKLKDAILFKNLEGKYVTAEEYLEKARTEETPEEPAAQETEAQQSEKPETGTVYYVTDEKEQGQYIRMFREAGMDAVMMLYTIDTPFISYYEQKKDNLRFVRIDADLTEDFKETREAGEEEQKSGEQLIALFRRVLGQEDLDVKVEYLKDASVASMMTMSEEGRRMQEMMKMYAAYGMGGMDLGTKDQTLILNGNNELVQRLMKEEGGEESLKDSIAEQLYDLALLSRGGLNQERMAAFIRRSQDLMLKL